MSFYRLKQFVFVLILNISYSLPVQLQLGNIPEDLLGLANTAKDVSYMSQDEKDVILYMNLARIDGKWFIKNVMEQNSSFIENESKRYVNSLTAALKRLKNIEPLYPSKNLTQSARFHAKDMGHTGKIGHRSSDGTDTFERIERYNRGNYMGENCQYGYSDPILIVLDLLIDGGIPSLGHRKNILSYKFKFTGVAIDPHKGYEVNCVQDFSDVE